MLGQRVICTTLCEKEGRLDLRRRGVVYKMGCVKPRLENALQLNDADYGRGSIESGGELVMHEAQLAWGY